MFTNSPEKHQINQRQEGWAHLRAMQGTEAEKMNTCVHAHLGQFLWDLGA